MAFSVTPGFGASVATELRGGTHHQRVIAHDDLQLCQVTPALTSGRIYTDGQAVGAELLFQNATRFAEDVVRLRELKLLRKGGETGADFDVVFYSAARAVAATDGQPFAMTAAEASGILAVVSVRAAQFGKAGGHCIASVPCDALLRGTVGLAAVRAQLVARGNFTAASATDLAVSIGVARS